MSRKECNYYCCIIIVVAKKGPLNEIESIFEIFQKVLRGGERSNEEWLAIGICRMLRSRTLPT